MIRILLAKDDTSVRGHLARTLERAGYSVTAVKDGPGACDMLRSETFDLLLTDMIMPGFDGVELAQRGATINPDLRVMLISGFAAVTLENGAAADESRQFSAPFHLRDVARQVDGVFQIGSAADL